MGESTKASRAAAAQRLADKKDKTKRASRFYEAESSRLRLRLEENIARRTQEVVDRDEPRTRPRVPVQAWPDVD